MAKPIPCTLVIHGQWREFYYHYNSIAEAKRNAKEMNFPIWTIRKKTKLIMDITTTAAYALKVYTFLLPRNVWITTEQFVDLIKANYAKSDMRDACMDALAQMYKGKQIKRTFDRITIKN